MRTLLAVGLASLLTLGACGKPAPAPAPAKSVDQASAAAVSSADQFVALAKGSETTGVVPRADDSRAGPLLNAVLDTSPIGNATLPDTEGESLHQWLLAVTKVGHVYLAAGSGTSDVNAAPDWKVGENTVKYGPEVGRYLDAQLTILAAAGSMMAAEAPASPPDPNRAQVFAGVKAILAQTISGELTAIAAQGMPVDWARSRVATMIAKAPAAAKYLDAGALAKLSQQASDIAGRVADTGLKADLQRLASLLSAPSSGATSQG